MSKLNTVLAEAYNWGETPTEAARKRIEAAAASFVAEELDPLGAAAAEEADEFRSWQNARAAFEAAYATYSSTWLEEDRVAAQWAQKGLGVANNYMRAAMTAKEFVAAALLAA